MNSAIKIIEQQWESPDDFWYVYISQRRKDNLGTFVKNHNSAGSRNFSVKFDKYQTHDGVHYVLNSRDAERLNFSKFDAKYRTQNAAKTRRNSDPMVLFKGDACILLYSACGY